MSNNTIKKTIDIDKIKNYDPKKEPILKLKNPPKIEQHVYKKTMRDIRKSQISRTRSIYIILECEEKVDQEHAWDNNDIDYCSRCGEHYKVLAEKDDSYLKFLLSNANLFMSMETIFIKKCPEFWNKNVDHNGDPCINCGWPNIKNQEYIDKYSYIFYNMLDVSKIKPPMPAHKQKKLSRYSLDTTEYQQQAGLTSIANRVTAKSHEHLLALIKQMFHLNTTKLEMNPYEISKLFNLQEINISLFKHRPSNTTLSSIVNVFMKSYEKGTEGTDMALELEDESVQHITDNDINIIDTIQIDETNKAIDNEDEIDQMVDQLSDIDDDIEQK